MREATRAVALVALEVEVVGVLRRDKPCPIAPPVHRLGKEGPAEHNRAPAASWRDARILANRRAAMRVSASIR